MFVIPAIDIQGGRCVRLVQGDFSRETVYGSNPVAFAKHWQAEGAKLLHVVDLDGARDGDPANLSVIREVIQSLSIPVQVGGGIRTPEAAEALLAAGAARVVVGTLAFEDRTAFERLLARHAPRLVVAIETKDGRLTVRGWQQEAGEDLLAAAAELEHLGVRRFLYTDVGKDGMLAGPNYEELGVLLKVINVPVIASGGIHSKEAIEVLRKLGAEAAIVGKALYEGIFTLREVQT